jgi:hypothetical protein
MRSSRQDVPRCQWFSRLAAFLDRRSAARLARLFLGAVLAPGRRTVISWIRAAGLSTQFRPCYTTAAAAGHRGTIPTGARATPTNAGHGVANFWPKKFVGFYAPGSPRRNPVPPSVNQPKKRAKAPKGEGERGILAEGVTDK